GGFPLEGISEGVGGVGFTFNKGWVRPASKRSEVVQSLLAGKSELCGGKGTDLVVHHIRKLAEIDRPGRRPQGTWERSMAARKRKSLVVCRECHDAIHGGHHDGPKL